MKLEINQKKYNHCFMCLNMLHDYIECVKGSMQVIEQPVTPLEIYLCKNAVKTCIYKALNLIKNKE